jgi:uncharacterized membrane protein
LLRRKKRVEFEVSPASFEALGLGAIAGMRSMAAPALLSRAIRRGDIGGPGVAPFAPLAVGKVSNVLHFLMIGEMIADKAPFAPDRTFFPSLLWRLVSGGLVGAAVFASEGRSRNSGAVLGALASLAASYVGERARKTNNAQSSALANPILGAVEDKIVLVLGPRLLRKRS